jgi:hypothetical protein
MTSSNRILSGLPPDYSRSGLDIHEFSALAQDIRGGDGGTIKGEYHDATASSLDYHRCDGLVAGFWSRNFAGRALNAAAVARVAVTAVVAAILLPLLISPTSRVSPAAPVRVAAP